MRRRTVALFMLLLLIGAAVAIARVGGGHSYSGGGSSSHGSGGGYSGGSSHSSSNSGYSGGSSRGSSAGPEGCGCFMLMVLAMIVIFVLAARTAVSTGAVYQASTIARPAAGDRLEDLRRFDPNFSRIVFEDFVYALFARVHHARGANDLTRYAPYVSETARKGLMARNPVNLQEVQGIVVGAIEAGPLLGLDAPVASVDVTFDANMTEVSGGLTPVQSSWYVKEQWTFERVTHILSPPPARAKAEHCPRCGAALQTRTDGSCEFCGVKIVDGSFQWYVTKITSLTIEPRGPLLTSNVPEQGTDLPSVRDRMLARRMNDFAMSHPGFRIEDVLARIRDIATKLQDAWTTRNWERARALETEPLFQMHRYWIEAYIRQHLKNIVDDFRIVRIEPVKIDSDAFYDAITVRQFASGRDYTVDDAGKVVSGSRDTIRSWSEYWTVVRTRATQSDPSATIACPNCGAAVVIGPSAICSHCGGKLTTGEFDWVLSRIEQDESYTG